MGRRTLAEKLAETEPATEDEIVNVAGIEDTDMEGVDVEAEVGAKGDEDLDAEAVMNRS